MTATIRDRCRRCGEERLQHIAEDHPFTQSLSGERPLRRAPPVAQRPRVDGQAMSGLVWEHEVVEEFGRPIRYSRVVEIGPLGPWVPYAPGDDNPYGAQARREFGPTGLAGLRVHPDLAAAIVVRAVR